LPSSPAKMSPAVPSDSRPARRRSRVHLTPARRMPANNVRVCRHPAPSNAGYPGVAGNPSRRSRYPSRARPLPVVHPEPEGCRSLEPLCTRTESRDRTPPRVGRRPTQNGIYEGAVVVKRRDLRLRLLGAGVGSCVGRSSWWRGAPAKAMRSRWSARSEARTNDLDATAGRRTLVRDDGWSVQPVRLSTRPEAGVRIGSLEARCGEVGQARLPRHLSVPRWAHDAIGATTMVGLTHFPRSAARLCWSCRSSSSPSMVVSEPHAASG
jgi:hypothetical protein